MNPVLLATASALTDATPENATISAPVAAESGGAFTLPQMALNAVAERIHSAKTNQQQSSAAQKHDNDPAAMQALMALFLAQPVQSAVSAGLQKQPDGDALKALIAARSANPGSPALRQLSSAVEQKANGTTPAQLDAADLSSLPAKLQSALTALTQQATAGQSATPEQQAKLATFSAQDLRAIAPQQPTLSTSQQITARVKETESHVAPRPQVVKKNAALNVTQPAVAQNLVNVAVQGNQSVSAIADTSAITTHTAQPVEMSPDELGEKLTALLKDRIQFQLGQQQQVSTIRLDPPSLGKLEIAVQLDAGKLMVHIGANQSDVCRSLQQFSENLRQHLTAQNFMEVNVQVSSEGQSQQQQQQQSGYQQDEVTSALMLNDEPQFQRNESVLIKV